MKTLLDAFALFLQSHPQFSQTDHDHVAQQLKMLLNADPEKIVLRQALEYYANEFNWPYQTQTPDGIQVVGMDVEEATEIARHAMASSDQLLKEIIVSLQQSSVVNAGSGAMRQAH
jgi:hypothetical protein